MATPDITIRIGADATAALTTLRLAAARGRTAFALLPAPPVPHGPHAARQIATDLAANGHHVHLVADSETRCLRYGCPTFPALDGVRPDPTEVLL